MRRVGSMLFGGLAGTGLSVNMLANVDIVRLAVAHDRGCPGRPPSSGSCCPTAQRAAGTSRRLEANNRREQAVISHFFIDRPIFASVLSIVIMLAGGVAVFTLPVAQYPDVTPPTVLVTAIYPGPTP